MTVKQLLDLGVNQDYVSIQSTYKFGKFTIQAAITEYGNYYIKSWDTTSYTSVPEGNIVTVLVINI